MFAFELKFDASSLNQILSSSQEIRLQEVLPPISFQQTPTHEIQLQDILPPIHY
jgi:hypothetical protein